MGNPFVWKPPIALLSAALDLTEHRQYRRGELIHEIGAEAQGIYFIVTGRVRMERMSMTGRPTLLTLLYPGSWLGDINVLLDLPRTDDAVADLDCSLSFLAKSLFLELLDRQPSLQMELLRAMTGRLRTTLAMLEHSQTATLPQRIAHRLLALRDAQDGDPLLPVTQQMIADMVGVTRENAARVLSRWRRQGLIETKRGRLELLDFARLSNL
ncbi:MAG: Crp/Fnr family transcriptional regulator [Sphingorhabdus sp.]